MKSIECTLILKRIYDAPLARVWRAWTEAEALARWYLAGDDHIIHSAQADVRVGGTYRVSFGAPGETPYIETGRYTEVMPMTRLAWTAEVVLEGGSGEPFGERVTLELADLGDGRTALTLSDFGEHSWQAAQGWIPCLNSLVRYLAAG